MVLPGEVVFINDFSKLKKIYIIQYKINNVHGILESNLSISILWTRLSDSMGSPARIKPLITNFCDGGVELKFCFGPIHISVSTWKCEM